MKQPGDTVTAELPLVAEDGGDIWIPSPNWRQALEAAVASHPQGKKGVAQALGVSRPYVSRVMTGHIPVAPERFVERVTAVLLRVQCPHLQRTLAPGECRSFAGRTYAQVNQFEVDHWRACRRCANRPADAQPAAAQPEPGSKPGKPSKARPQAATEQAGVQP